MSGKILVDPDGDVALQLPREHPSENTSEEKSTDSKQGIKELIVSSKVLSLASPVFKSMVTGGFKGGVELAQTNKANGILNPCAIDLPEDDAGAIVLLCKVLHYYEVPKRPTTLCLEKLAYLCDKYQCTGAMKYCGGVWVRDWLRVYDSVDPSIDNLCRLLIFVYVIDLPYEFLGIAWKLFLLHKGPFLGTYSQTKVLAEHPLLRQDLARMP